MKTIYIGIGSNLENPLLQVNQACDHLGTLPDIKLIALSPLYQSKAIGPEGQPDYINGVIKLQSSLSPLALLDLLHTVENKHGRERHIRWGARTLDLDILLFGEDKIQNDRLTIPHIEMKNRNFVIQPLFDLANDLILPCQASLASVRHAVKDQTLVEKQVLKTFNAITDH